MSSLFDYDDSQQVAFQAKTAGKSLIAAKYDVIKATGDFLFNAHTDGEFAQRCEMIDNNLNKIAYNKLASLSDSKMKLVKALHTEWSLRHAKCEDCTNNRKFAKSTCEKCADGELDSDSPLCKACRGKEASRIFADPDHTVGHPCQGCGNNRYNTKDDGSMECVNCGREDMPARDYDKKASRKVAVSDAEADAWENHPADCDCKLCTNKDDTWGKDIEPSRNKGYNKGDDSAKVTEASIVEAIFDPSWLHQVGHGAAQLAHGLIAPWTHKPSMGPGGIPDTNIKDTLIAGGELAAGAAGAAALYNKKKKSKYNNDEEDRPFDWEKDASRKVASDSLPCAFCGNEDKYSFKTNICPDCHSDLEHDAEGEIPVGSSRPSKECYVCDRKGHGSKISVCRSCLFAHDDAGYAGQAHLSSRTASDGWSTDENGNSTYSEPGQDSWSGKPHTECQDCGAKYEYKGAHPNNFCVGSSSRHEGSYKTSWGIPDQCDGCDQETLNPAQDGWHSEYGLYCPDCADRGYCGCDDCQSGPINPFPHEEMGPHQHGDCPYCSGSECPTCQAMDSGDGEPEQETQLHDELHEKWHRDNGDSPCTSAEDCDRKSRNYKES